jgi:hypothetical protein
MADHPAPPDAGSLRAQILAIIAGLDRDALRIDLEDPAFVSLVDRAVRPFERALTPEGVAKARRTATFGLLTRPDRDALLERERARLAKQGSGVQPSRSGLQLDEVTRRSQGNGER